MESPAAYYERIAGDYRQDRFGNSYGRFVDAAERRWLGACLRTAPPGPILDLACGDGRLTDLADCGLDLTAGMLRHARAALPHGDFVRGDATRLPFRDAGFAAIFSLHLVMHLPPPQLCALLAEARRCLRPGGLLMIDFPGRLRRGLRAHRSDIGAWHGHSAYRRREVLAMAEGFTHASSTGLLLLPIQRLPARLRPRCAGLDRGLSRLLRPLASYQLLCLRRE